MTDEQIVEYEQKLNKAKELKAKIDELQSERKGIETANLIALVSYMDSQGIGTLTSSWNSVMQHTIPVNSIPNPNIKQAMQNVKEALSAYLSAEIAIYKKELSEL